MTAAIYRQKFFESENCRQKSTEGSYNDAEDDAGGGVGDRRGSTMRSWTNQ